MPFGYNCEYDDFEDCVGDQMDNDTDKESAERICGDIKNETEGDC